MLGLLMEKEVKAVDAVLSNIKRPFVAIMGGSKVSSKIGIIENLLGKVDKLILCGGMTYTFAKAHNGEIGDSIVELDKLDVALGVEALAKKNGVELVLGSDCTATNGLDFGTMRVLTLVLRARRLSLRQSRVPRPFCGTVLQVSSSATTSLPVAVLSVMPSPRLPLRVLSH